MVNTNQGKNLHRTGFLSYFCIYQVSDKRQLQKCGNGKSFLVETGTISLLPSGRHIRGAEV